MSVFATLVQQLRCAHRLQLPCVCVASSAPEPSLQKVASLQENKVRVRFLGLSCSRRKGEAILGNFSLLASSLLGGKLDRLGLTYLA